MVSALAASQPGSWKDCLLGTGLCNGEKEKNAVRFYEEEDFDLSKSDVVRSIIDGIPSINFSDRVNQILIKDMAHTVVIKLLERNIGYSALYNKVCSL